jgi:hypothetical protein
VYDAGWVDGYDQGRREGFRRGYRAAIAAAGEVLERFSDPCPHRPSDQAEAVPTVLSTVPAVTAPVSGSVREGAALIEGAHRSWQLPDPADASTTPSGTDVD